MGGICYVVQLPLGDSHGSAWAKSQKVNLEQARPEENMVKLATGSWEMPLNQQLRPATADRTTITHEAHVA